MYADDTTLSSTLNQFTDGTQHNGFRPILNSKSRPLCSGRRHLKLCSPPRRPVAFVSALPNQQVLIHLSCRLWAALPRSSNKCVVRSLQKVLLTLKSSLVVYKGQFTSIESLVISCKFRWRFLQKTLKMPEVPAKLSKRRCCLQIRVRNQFFCLVVVLYTVIMIRSSHTPPPAYGLYACENDDNYG